MGQEIMLLSFPDYWLSYLSKGEGRSRLADKIRATVHYTWLFLFFRGGKTRGNGNDTTK